MRHCLGGRANLRGSALWATRPVPARSLAQLHPRLGERVVGDASCPVRNLTQLHRSLSDRSLPALAPFAGSGCIVIMLSYDDNMIRTQISVDEELYRRAKQVARRKGISLAELCRRSLAEAVAREPDAQPWMSFAGILDGEESDSSSIDAVVYGRETP